jgi:hypothetical protein
MKSAGVKQDIRIVQGGTQVIRTVQGTGGQQDIRTVQGTEGQQDIRTVQGTGGQQDIRSVLRHRHFFR